jgi:uncharacterized protein
MALMVSNVPWTKDGNPREQLCQHLQISNEAVLEFELLKRSVDARRRPPVWQANYRVVLQDEPGVLSRKLHGVRAYSDRDKKRYQQVQLDLNQDMFPPNHRTIVIGAGPAGMFGALRFAEGGSSVLLIERGGAVEDRHYHVRDFWRHRKLNPQSNVVYGEGGAGAFSDGKIYTRRRDGELGWVFRRLVDFGADPEILEEGWAHLGTDKIREILPNLRNRIVELGSEVRFDTVVTELIVENGRCVGVRMDDGKEEYADVVVVATGHSARDSWKMMLSAGAKAEQRSIRIGARIEHPQKMIDVSQYGTERGDLPAASYRLVSRPSKDGGKRGAHTFCMCPGGTVVGATSEEGRIVVNGMSYSGRKAFWANSAIIVEVTKEDFGSDDPMAGVYFQDRLERKAFELGGGDFNAPAQRVVDFLQEVPSIDLPRTSYTQGVTPSNLWDLFPRPIAEGLREAIQFFDRKIKGFAGAEGVLIAPETRTTAPLCFLRTDKMEAVGLPGMMPIGEGAGYAGGIASAALEGFRAAEVQMLQFKGT